MKLTILLVLILLLSCVKQTEITHSCIHKNIHKKYVSHEKEKHVFESPKNNNRRRRINTLRQLKIKAYTNFDNERVSTLLKEVLDMFSEIIQTKPRKLSHSTSIITCGLFTYEKKPVEDYDLYLFASFNEYDCEPGTIAYASPCKSFSDGKPISGMINICPIPFKLSDEEFKLTLIHEIFHVLVLSPSTIEDNEHIKVDHFFEKNSIVKKMFSPELIAYGKEFFNCSTFNGIEFDQSSFHFENRLYFDDLMSPYFKSGGTTMFTKLDLLLLHSTGWYFVNDFSKANVSLWGLGTSCKFVDVSCKYAFKSGISSPYCFSNFGDNENEKCSGTKRGYGTCQQLKEYDTRLPNAFRYFKKPNIGGNVENKFCPIVKIDTHCNGQELCFDSVCRESKCDDEHNFFVKIRDKWEPNPSLNPYCILKNNFGSILEAAKEVNMDLIIDDVLTLSKYATNTVDFIKKWIPMLFTVNGFFFEMPMMLGNGLLKGICYNMLLKGIIFNGILKSFCYNFILKGIIIGFVKGGYNVILNEFVK